MTRPRMIAPLLAHALKIATLAIFGVHFALTFLYCLPLNPVSLSLGPFLQGTIGTFFPQNWRLFAPNPVGSSQTVLVRCLAPGEADPVARDDEPSIGWYDITAPVIARYQERRFSAYDRLARPGLNAARAYLTGGIALGEWRESCQKGDERSCTIYKQAFELTRKGAGRNLQRIGSSFCRDVLPGRSLARVALRTRDVSALPWSKRDGGEHKTVDVDLGVYDFLPTVETVGLYRPEVMR